MTFIDYIRRQVDPQGAAERSAPSRPVNNAMRRRNRIDPRLPRADESFADFVNRGGRRSLARMGGAGEAARQVETDAINATGDRAIDRADREGSPTPGQEIAQVFREGLNARNMRLSDIPMGVETSFPRIDSPTLPTRGGQYVSGARFGADGMPTEMTRDSINWESPQRRQGLVSWGVDLRRPERDVLADVSRVAGAPPELLNMISMRESDLRAGRRQYDQGGPDSTSAQGPHQFTAGTWKTWASGVGGQYGIETHGLSRDEILDMRYDIRASGAMTAEMARYHASLISGADPGGPHASPAEIYLMHHGGEEALGLIEAVRRGDNSGAASRFYSAAAVRNHMSDFYVGGNPSRPRTSRQYFDWMTGNSSDSPHRRDYRGRGMEGLPTSPVQFTARADGTSDVASVIRPGVVRIERRQQ